MGKIGRTFLEGHSKQARQVQRKQLGSLKSLTVSPKTNQRYTAARQKFYEFLDANHLSLPRKREHLDGLLSEYIEFLWSEGEGRGLASDTVAGLQDADPKLKGQLPATWSTNEIPNRAPPLTETAVHAMVGWSFLHGHYGFGISLLLAFYGMLRTGEVTEVRNSNIFMKSASSPAVVSLGLTKSGKRAGAAESVTITADAALKWLWQWKSLAVPSARFVESVSAWRTLFKTAVAALEITLFEFRPYSLRRGGATFWFAKHGSFDKLLISGRWQAAKTARIYINEGMAALADLKLPSKSLTPFVRAFHSHRFPQHLNSRSRARKRGAWKEVFVCHFLPTKKIAWPMALGLARGHRKVKGGFPILRLGGGEGKLSPKGLWERHST